MKKIWTFITTLLLGISLSSTLVYAMPYNIYDENNRDMFQKYAYCKISSSPQTLLSFLDDIHYEEKYDLSDLSKLLKQCRTPLKVRTFLKNNTWDFFYVSSEIFTPFPRCREIDMMMVWGSFAPINNEFYMPGRIQSQPLVFDSQYKLFTYGSLVLEYNWDTEPLKTRHGATVQISSESPFVANVSSLPECTPNVRLKK